MISSINYMDSVENTVGALLEEGNYHYRELAEQSSRSPLFADPQHASLLNTVELFAFGNYAHYLKYKDQYVELPPSGVRKLAQLTLLAICNENEGNKVSFDTILKDHALTHALSIDAMEQLVIGLVDEHVISAQIDEETYEVEFLESFDTRDAYNSSTYQLRVLSEEDVANRSVTRARAQLQSWVDHQIGPAQAELKE